MKIEWANRIFMALTLLSLTLVCFAQEPEEQTPESRAERKRQRADNDKENVLEGEEIVITEKDKKIIHLVVDSTYQTLKDTIPVQWVPDSKRAMWLAIAIPGGGQIYNRKYWKLPIIYGGFLGCAYAIKWNNTMYRDYSQAYIDIMDDDPNTHSYDDFVPIGYDVKANEQRLKDLFKRKKDYYRRYRDLSIFCMIGVYALSVIDAYVDAELSSFDISRDLSMKVRPAVISPKSGFANRASMMPSSYGVSVGLEF